jgi:hypothetical protein
MENIPAIFNVFQTIKKLLKIENDDPLLREKIHQSFQDIPSWFQFLSNEENPEPPLQWSPTILNLFTTKPTANPIHILIPHPKPDFEDKMFEMIKKIQNYPNDFQRITLDRCIFNTIFKLFFSLIDNILLIPLVVITLAVGIPVLVVEFICGSQLRWTTEGRFACTLRITNYVANFIYSYTPQIINYFQNLCGCYHIVVSFTDASDELDEFVQLELFAFIKNQNSESVDLENGIYVIK